MAAVDLFTEQGYNATAPSSANFPTQASCWLPRETYRCGLDAAIDVFGGRWKALILWAGVPIC
jgi:hypothetical protein